MELNGAIVNTPRCIRKSEIQDGGLQTGYTYISASRQDRSEIPTANPTCSRSSNSMGLVGILCDQTGSGKSNMAASKPDILISQLLDKIETKFQRHIGFSTSGLVVQYSH